MLTVTTKRDFLTSDVRSTLVLERRFRMHVVQRNRLVFDSRFHPSFPGTTGATLFVVLSGQVQIGDAAALPARQALLLSEAEFEQVAPEATKLRTWGAPNLSLEIRFAPGDVRVPAGLAHGPLPLPPHAWARCEAIARACAEGTPLEQLVHQLLGDLRDAGVIDESVVTSIPPAEPDWIARLWAGLVPFMSGLSTATSARDVARATGRSLRQLGRDTQSFTKTFELGDGFREVTRLVRVRLAVLLLSAPNATATEVARNVGYNSLEAMERAFRDAKLPPPSTIQKSMRYPDE